MRKTLLILGIAIAAVAGGWYFFIYLKAEEPAASGPQINEYPYMNLTGLDGKVQSARDLPGRCILIFFNPDCDHCQREAVLIRDHLDSFGTFGLYFISSDSLENIERFAEEYGLAGKENVHFARTEVEEVIRNFGPIPAPSIYIYSSTKKLFREFKNETPIDQILGALSGQ
jgi:hypothetical protein